jgi:hypothetical protein
LLLLPLLLKCCFLPNCHCWLGKTGCTAKTFGGCNGWGWGWGCRGSVA